MKKKHTPQPPAWIRNLLSWYCGERAAEDLVGDMDELFHTNLKTMSSLKARLKYFGQAVVLLISSGVRKRKRRFPDENKAYQSLAMYRSYATIAFRNLAKQKAFSFINMICLSVGMSIGLLALSVWLDVREVDDFHVNRDRIYRLFTTVDNGTRLREYATSSAPAAQKLWSEAAGIEEMVEFDGDFAAEVVQSENSELPLQGYFASQAFFSMFTFPLAEGDARTALEKPFSVVLTREASEKLFRKLSPLGKILEIKGLGNFEVTGVLAEHGRSHFDFEILGSYSTLALLEGQGKRAATLQNWGPLTSHYTYVKVRDDDAIAAIEAVAQRIVPAFPKTDKPVTATFSLQALRDIPSSDLRNEIGLGWGDLSLYLFFFLAFLVLLPACFNYANIAIARALKRAKEIGLRKVSGGESRHIFFQMLVETVVLSVISLSGAILIFMLVRNGFLSMVVNGPKTFDLQITPLSLGVFVLFGIFTGLAAGFFPALYFSRLSPIETLRNSSQSGRLSKVSVRKGLIVAQFVLSLFFVLSVSIIFKQYHYALNFDRGFQKENILDIPLKNVKASVLETELRKLPEVAEISMASYLPGNWQFASVYARTMSDADTLEIFQMFINESYLRNLELTLLAGADFKEGSGAEHYIIANETLLKNFKLGTPAEAIGKSLLVENQELRVIGVVKDFNYMPLQEQIRNFFFRYDPSQFRYANVKLSTTDLNGTLEKIGRVWNTLSDQQYEARLLDDELEASVVSYKAMIKIFGFMGMLAITISCLGLLAVVISAAESRIKEMGIRKIMGATIPELALSLSKGFLILIGVAILIATPLTYFIFDRVFLRLSFYRGVIGFTEMAAGILLLVVLIAAIIGSQTIKVARVNPVDTLKCE